MTKGIKTGGRKKGTPNKSTKEIRDNYQLFVENNIDKFQAWIDSIATKNPAKAMELVISLGEYIIPKLSKTEFKAEVGQGNDYDFSKWSTEDLMRFVNLEKQRKVIETKYK